MIIVSVEEAEADLPHLIDAVARGEAVTICRAGTPIARLVAVDHARSQRLGFLAGQASIPDDFDSTNEQLEAYFGALPD